MRHYFIAIFLFCCIAQTQAAEIDSSHPNNVNTDMPTGGNENAQIQDIIGNIELRPSISFSTGYDSNFDEEPEAVGSNFLRTDVGLEILYQSENGNEFSAEANGLLIDFSDLEDPERWELRAGFDADIGIGDKTRLTFGAERLYDDTIPPLIINDSAYVEVEKKHEHFELSLRGSIEHEANDSDDVDDIAFDYVKPEFATSLRLNTLDRISPYASLRVANVDFPNQGISATSLDRSATDYSLQAGLRLKPIDDLTIDIGGRFNQRLFKSGPRDDYSSVFVDLNIEWEPTENLSVEGFIERDLSETSSSSSLVDDVTIYNISATYDVTDKVSVRTAAQYKIKEKIGADETEREQLYRLTARYDPLESIRFFAELLYGHTTETNDDEYERVLVRVGARAKM